jgi:hypothetical protein
MQHRHLVDFEYLGISWVTTMPVNEGDRDESIRFKIVCPVTGSSPVVGSSINIISGFQSGRQSMLSSPSALI